MREVLRDGRGREASHSGGGLMPMSGSRRRGWEWWCSCEASVCANGDWRPLGWRRFWRDCRCIIRASAECGGRAASMWSRHKDGTCRCAS
eukprot:13438377-Alexandrium_andersonii.AAC.1